jgi:hypothetical protein
LTPEDDGEAYSLFDARVGGSVPPGPPVCAGTGCQGVPAPPPTFATPASVTFAGVGNFPAPPPVGTVVKTTRKSARCKKGFVKRHAKCTKVKANKKHANAKRAGGDRRGK